MSNAPPLGLNAATLIALYALAGLGTRFGPSPDGSVLPAASVSSVRGFSLISASSLLDKRSVAVTPVDPKFAT